MPCKDCAELQKHVVCLLDDRKGQFPASHLLLCCIHAMQQKPQNRRQDKTAICFVFLCAASKCKETAREISKTILLPTFFISEDKGLQIHRLKFT